MKKKFNLILITCLFIFYGCGYKVIDKSGENNFSLAQISTGGDRRINYILKNDMKLSSKKNSENILDLEIISKKNKEIREKNINNQITKYTIKINVDVKFSLVNDDKKYKVSSSESGDYTVADNYSTTLTNEKSLIENLVENISDEIKEKISEKLNAI